MIPFAKSSLIDTQKNMKLTEINLKEMGAIFEDRSKSKVEIRRNTLEDYKNLQKNMKNG